MTNDRQFICRSCNAAVAAGSTRFVGYHSLPMTKLLLLTCLLIFAIYLGLKLFAEKMLVYKFTSFWFGCCDRAKPLQILIFLGGLNLKLSLYLLYILSNHDFIVLFFSSNFSITPCLNSKLESRSEGRGREGMGMD